MNDIQIFNSPEFGEVRTVIIDEKEYFFGVDVARALMYKRPSKAITDNCKGVLIQDTIKNEGGYPEPLIPEGDIYRLIIKAGQQGNSKEIKQKADKLEKWIFDEVLPQLRKTGSYGAPQLPMSTQEQIKLLAQGNVELNQKVDNLTERMDKIELDLPILPIEADRITTAVKRKGVSVLGGKQSAAYKNRALRQSLYNNLYANLKYNFGCRSYKAIKRSQTDKAIEIVERYTPPFFLAEKIETENARG